MSRRYDLTSTISVTGEPDDLAVLDAILDDEEKRIGSRASFDAVRNGNAISIAVHASDATALKTAISAISAIIRTAEKMTTIR